VTVTGDSPDAQLMVRAQQGRFLIDARFDRLGLKRHYKAVVSIGKGPEGPIALLAGRPPVERRILRTQ
jgi:hypothetical protein